MGPILGHVRASDPRMLSALLVATSIATTGCSSSPAQEPGSPLLAPTTGGGLGLCIPAQVLLSVTTDARSYTAGSEVVITVHLANRTASPCRAPAANCVNPTVRVTDLGAGSVWTDLPPAACTDGRVGPVLGPHHVVTTVRTWDQEMGLAACARGSCQVAPRAEYQVTATYPPLHLRAGTPVTLTAPART